MQHTLNTLSIPHNYSYCFRNQCVKKEECMRYVAAQMHASPPASIKIIHPHYIPEDTSVCPHFNSMNKARIAWGVKRLFDNIPHTTALKMRQEIIGHFGKNLFYRMYHHKRGITPGEQQYILQVFRKNNIMEEPAYDYFTEEYNFM